MNRRQGTMRRKALLAACFLLLAAVAQPRYVHGAEARKVREATVAGAFYPGNPDKLAAMMDAMLATADPAPVEGKILAAVAPHAGYPYSGPVAAYTYAALRGHSYKRVVVLAPSHFVSFDFTSVYDGDAYTTPLGAVPVDKKFAYALTQLDPSIQLSGKGHTPTAAGGEHALEVQLPWLQHVLGDFTLVPIVMGNQSYESSRALGVALAKLIAQEHGAAGETLVLASSDLSHYHPYDEAVQIDSKTLAALSAWNYYSMARNFESRIWEACGGAPIVAAMIYAERMGARQATVLKYANSGDAAGDKSRVVGYGAALFVNASAKAAADPPFALTQEEKKELLAIARHSVESAVGAHQEFEPAPSANPRLNREFGAFVTLTRHGQLRGCIGYTSAIKPLYLTVRDTATLAALRDPRFAAVEPGELASIEYEVSVLSPLRRVMDAHEIEMGRDGLLIKNGGHEGLLLPQVPGEFGWDRTAFLEHTCAKAGLPRDCWQSEATDIFRFTADVFHEEKLEEKK